MTFNSNADVSGSGAKRRGPGGGAIAGGVGGLGAIAVILLSIFTGGDFTSLLTGQGSGGSQAGSESEISQCDTGADANANDDCRLAAGSLAINQFWAQQVQGYRRPRRRAARHPMRPAPSTARRKRPSTSTRRSST